MDYIYFEIRNRSSCFTFSSFHSSTTPNITSLFSCKIFATVIYNNLFYSPTLQRCRNTQVCRILTVDFQYHATKMIAYLVSLDHTTIRNIPMYVNWTWKHKCTMLIRFWHFVLIQFHYITYFNEIELLFRLIRILLSRVIQKNIHLAPYYGAKVFLEHL
jgi:hypothetical protein